MAQPDLSVFAKNNGYSAYQRANEEFMLKKQLALAEAQSRQDMMDMKRQEMSQPDFKVVGNQIVQMDRATGQVVPVYEAPSTAPINQMTGMPERKLSSTEQKELFDTMDLTSSGEAAKGALLKAQDILKSSPKGAEPYTGFAAETRAAAARIPVIGDLVADKERGASTTEYRTLVQEQALNNLKAIFGGMPTEGERQVLMQMQAMPSFTPQEQEKILQNAITAADKRLKFNQQKAKAIQTGQYSNIGNFQPQPSTGGWTIEAID